MAHFRAYVEGARSRASRLGHKKTGIKAVAQTWGWDVLVDVWHLDSAGTNGQDWADVELVNHTTGERRHVAHLNLTTGEPRLGALHG